MAVTQSRGSVVHLPSFSPLLNLTLYLDRFARTSIFLSSMKLQIEHIDKEALLLRPQENITSACK